MSGYAKVFSWYYVDAITNVRDIGSCGGASMAVAATKLYETEYYRETTWLYDLSAEYVLECSGVASCENTSITHQNLETILKWQATTGIPKNSEWPYTAGGLTTGKPTTSGICESANKVTCSNKIHLHKKHKIGKGTLKKWIAKNPTANLIHADEAFSSVTANDLVTPYECSKNSPSDKELNHALNAIGYDEHKNWVVQNNWGTDWGNNGYLLLKHGKECGLRRRVFRYNWSLNAAVTFALVLVSLFAF